MKNVLRWTMAASAAGLLAIASTASAATAQAYPRASEDTRLVKSEPASITSAPRMPAWYAGPSRTAAAPEATDTVTPKAGAPAWYAVNGHVR